MFTLDKLHNFLNISELYIIYEHNELINNTLQCLHSFLTANRSEAIRIAFHFACSIIGAFQLSISHIETRQNRNSFFNLKIFFVFEGTRFRESGLPLDDTPVRYRRYPII